MGQQAPIRDLGPCHVDWGGTDLGTTFGGATFRATQDVAPVMEDDYGNDPVDEIFVGSGCEVECNLTRMAIATLVAITPGASGSGTSGNTMVVRATTGRSSYDNALKLIVKPVVGGTVSTTSTEWITIFKAHPKIEYELPYDVDSQRTFKVTFKGYRVQADAVGEKIGWLWKIG